MNEFQFRVALLRKNISQNQLALRLGVIPQNLSSMVRGYRKMPEDLSTRIAEELEIDEEVLFPQNQISREGGHVTTKNRR